MTQDQLMGLIRQLIPVIGGLLVSIGFLSPETVAKLTGLWAQIGGGLVVVIGGIWAYVANSKASIIKSATAMPEVDSTKLQAAIADPALKDAAKP
jgi:hypothetical protein